MNQNLLRINDVVAVRRSGNWYSKGEYDKALVTELRVKAYGYSNERPRKLKVRFWAGDEFENRTRTIDSKEVVNFWEEVEHEVEEVRQREEWRNLEDKRIDTLKAHSRKLLREIQARLGLSEDEYGKLTLDIGSDITFSTAGTSMNPNSDEKAERVTKLIHALYEEVVGEDEKFSKLSFTSVPKPWEVKQEDGAEVIHLGERK